MKISVVTVCYNSEQVIEKTVQSVVNQTFDDFEYLIIDGASTDRTLEIVRKYQEKSDKIKIFSEKDRGIYDAMNKGIAHASGDYIVFLNADDVFLHENVLKLAAEKMKDDVDLYYGDLVFLEKATGKLNNRRQNNVNYVYLCGGMLFHPAIFASAKLFEKIGNFDLQYKIVADYDWVLRALVKKKSTCKYLDMPITIFADGEGASSNPKNKELHKNERQAVQKKYFSPLMISVSNFLYKSMRSSLSFPIIKNILHSSFQNGR
ncbi:MAG: glycosyltransferase [Candidatus Gastranaerophilales bacterium]|nr:glycosyltransferase [Candidatus Gastranaerophilales bacterium]